MMTMTRQAKMKNLEKVSQIQRKVMPECFQEILDIVWPAIILNPILWQTFVDIDTSSTLVSAPRQFLRKTRKSVSYDKLGARRKHKANFIFVPLTTTEEPTMVESLSATPAEVHQGKETIYDELCTLKDKRTWSRADSCAKNIRRIP